MAGIIKCTAAVVAVGLSALACSQPDRPGALPDEQIDQHLPGEHGDSDSSTADATSSLQTDSSNTQSSPDAPASQPPKALGSLKAAEVYTFALSDRLQDPNDCYLIFNPVRPTELARFRFSKPIRATIHPLRGLLVRDSAGFTSRFETSNMAEDCPKQFAEGEPFDCEPYDDGYFPIDPETGDCIKEDGGTSLVFAGRHGVRFVNINGRFVIIDTTNDPPRNVDFTLSLSNLLAVRALDDHFLLLLGGLDPAFYRIDYATGKVTALGTFKPSHSILRFDCVIDTSGAALCLDNLGVGRYWPNQPRETFQDLGRSYQLGRLLTGQ